MDALSPGAAEIVGVNPLPLPLLPGAGGMRTARAGPGPGAVNPEEPQTVASAPAGLPGQGGALGAQFQAEQAKKDAAIQEIKNAAVQRDAAQAPLAARMAEVPKPADPAYTKLPEAPRHLPMSQQEMGDFMSTMFAFAAIGGAMTRTPMTTALNAFSSAMKGLQEGDAEKFKRDSAAFKQNMDAAVAKNQQAHQEYTDAWSKNKNSMGNLMQEWQLIATKYNDTVGLATLQMKDASEMLKHIENGARLDMQMKKADQQFAISMAKMDQQQRQFDQRMAAQNGGNGGGLAPQAIDMLAREAIKDKGVLANLGRGVQGAKDLRAITNRMAEIMESEGGPGMAQRRQEFRADSNSLNKLTMSYDAITAFEQTAVRNGEMLKQLANKVDATGVPVVEKWIRAGRQATGDPDVAQFNAQLQVYRTEAARILTNPNLTGQLTDSARKEVEAFMGPGASAKQITGTVDLLTRDFDNRKKTLEKQMEDIRDRMTTGTGAGAPQRRAGDKPAAAPAGPAVGTEQGGYRFNGGDPASPANWTKI